MKPLANEAGHTLLETLVAMALFTGVVLPLGTILGNFMLDRSHIQLQDALRLAESEMGRIAATREFGSRSFREGDFLIETVPSSERTLIELTVTVRPANHSEKTLVRLTKTFLTYQ